MDRIPVDSRALAEIGYDAKTQILEAQFPNGEVYDYSPISQSVWDDIAALIASGGSVGTYFMANVRNSYRGRKV